MVCRSAGFELVQGDERIVAIFRYTGLPALMVPDPHQYDLVRDKFVGIEQKDLSAIYGPSNGGLCLCFKRSNRCGAGILLSIP